MIIRMQLISVGDVFLNLDQIAVLDVDPSPNGPVLKVHVKDSQAVIEIIVSQATVAALFNLVPQTLRLPGRDA